MPYEIKTIDGLGVFVPVTGVTAAQGWELAKDTAINLMALGESENYFYDDFSDADAASGENFEHDAVNKCLKNTITAATGEPESLVPALTSNTSTGIAFCKYGDLTNREIYKAFDGLTGGTNYGYYSNGGTNPQYFGYAFESNEKHLITSVGIKPYANRGLYDFEIQATNDVITGSGTSSNADSCTWTTLKSFTSQTWTNDVMNYFDIEDITETYSAYRVYVTDSADNQQVSIEEMKIFGYAETDFLAVVNEATITLDNYVPQTMPDKCILKLWLENFDDGSVMPDLGNSGSNKIECYISTDGGLTFSSALNFTLADLQPAPNIFVFDSDKIDLNGATGLQIKLQSFNRDGASGAPNFKWHAALALEKTGD